MKTFVAITVDTEFSSHPKDMGIRGNINGQDYGLPLILKLLNDYNFKATFFVDVYTIHKEYLQSFQEMCLELKRHGHDLELHTHPQGSFDSKRFMIKNYSLSEQIDIIKKGKELFEDWFKVTPIAHRAGDWGANVDTLEALTRNDIWIDSSMFYGWKNCGLNGPPLTKNLPVWHKNCLEIPASVFECVPLKVFSPYRLVSTDGNSFAENKELIGTLQSHQVPVINLVYHSFSFIKWNNERTQYAVSSGRLKKFKTLLNYLSKQDNLKVATIKEIGLEIKNNHFDNNTDYIPKRGTLASLERVMDRLTN
jgi:hypothetical protein